mmetsp:Transcript_18614/g.46192  ORF Transcript_18614/g.46192 Transcript_18614/m.46192 type:complete len:227 (+) Transcript_18614:279-959(+)
MEIPRDIEMDEMTFDKTGDTSETFSLENHPPSCNENNQTAKTAALPMESSVLQLVSTGTELVNLDDQRIADLCCGVCCDLVRACIIVDCCDIALSIMLVVLSALGYSEFFIDTINFNVFDPIDDDVYREGIVKERNIYTFTTVMTACGIFFSIIGIVGAMRFHKYMVLATAIWFCVDVIRCVVTFQWINTVVTGCYAYPHIALFLALRNGKMTRERYHIEKHCCCV